MNQMKWLTGAALAVTALSSHAQAQTTVTM